MFTDPHWLLLIIPAIWLIFAMSPASRKILVLRIALVLVIVAALAGLQLRMPGRDGVIVAVADRSLSMPANSDLRVNETLALLKKNMPANARLGLVSFADETRVEMAPARSSFTGFTAEINQEASNLDDGINRALSLIPEDLSGRLILISDGLWSGRDPRQAAFHAAGRGIPIDYRVLSRNMSDDLAITSFAVPGILNPGEAFLVTAEIYSPAEQLAMLGLYSADRLIASVSRQLKRGANSFMFSMTAPLSSVVKYRLQVTSQNKDPLPENNQAVAISEVVGKKPLLVISDSTNSPLYELLKKSGRQAELKNPLEISWNIEFLAGYSAVVIENVSANRITLHGMQVLAAWIRHLGGGLLTTGGKNSYGNGGYYQSPLEPVLPVSLELRSQNRKLALALMVVLDRSGSMAAPARGDRTKMDLANIAAASALDLLSPLDEFGLLAVDTEPHVVVPLQRMSDKGRWREKIMHVESMGGGIYVYEGISAAADMLLKAEARTRHIILFADASDSEQPGRYWELLEKATSAGLTLSVIGLGTETDSDANLLIKIAAAGKGRIFFTREPEELPRLFSQDTFVAARSTFIEEPAAVESLPAIRMFVPGSGDFSSQIGAYNLCYVKPDAYNAIRTTDENNAPVLAAWQCGLGRVACFTGVVDGEAAGHFAGQPQAADTFSGVCSWLALDDRQNLAGMPVAQHIANGRWQARIYLDPEREREVFRHTPEVDIIRSFAGREPELETIKMTWENADTLMAELRLRGNEVITGMVRSGDQRVRLYPICQPYAQEYSPTVNRSGSEELKEIAGITGGKELIDLNHIWDTLPATVQFRNLSGELLLLALFIFLLEVAERRTGALTILLKYLRRQAERPHRASVPAAIAVNTTAAEKIVTGGQLSKPAAAVPVAEILRDDSEETPVAPPPADSGFSNALKQAKKHAGQRTRK